VIPRPENPLIVALDTSDRGRFDALATSLGPVSGMLKVGLEAYAAFGPEAIRAAALHAPVFADLKLHDIPNTVEHAMDNLCRIGVAMVNVHALGGVEMMRAAMRGAERGCEGSGRPMPLVIAVTVLSSQAGEDLASPASLAWEAREAGLHGVVVSGEDVREVRDVCGDAFCLVVPGIRPTGGNGDDQVRVLTPAAAIERGADYLVVGRPITGSADPVGVARGIVLATR
jgi:orotidine-5'-phosphate decarboxylase